MNRDLKHQKNQTMEGYLGWVVALLFFLYRRKPQAKTVVQKGFCCRVVLFRMTQTICLKYTSFWFKYPCTKNFNHDKIFIIIRQKDDVYVTHCAKICSDCARG